MDSTGSTPYFLEAAHSLALQPILLSTRPWRYREFPAANAVRLRQLTVESVVAAIDRIGRDRVAGVYSARSVHAELAARVAQAIGRPHSDPEAIALCHQKYAARRYLENKGFADVPYRNAGTAHEAASFVEEFEEAVVKPYRSTGAAGVKICRTPEEAFAHAELLLPRNPDGVLMEKFIDGPLFAVDAYHGKVFGIRRFILSDRDASVILGDEAPAPVPAEVCQSLRDHVETALELIGYTKGVAHVQVVLAGNRPHLIEINPRLPAGVASAAIRRAFGVDLPDLCLRFACGLPDRLDPSVLPEPRQVQVALVVLRIEEPIRAIEGIEEASSVPHVVGVGAHRALFGQRGAPGTAIQIGYVHCAADTPELARESAMAGLDKLRQVPLGRARYWLAKVYEPPLRRLRYGRAR